MLPEDINYSGLNKQDMDGWKAFGKRANDAKGMLKRKNTELELYGGAINYNFLRVLPSLMEIKLNETYFKKIRPRIRSINEKYIGVH